MQDKYQAFLSRLSDIAAGKSLPTTLIINDPLSNSFVGPRTNRQCGKLEAGENNSDDKVLKVEEYERTFLQNESLGLNHVSNGED